MLLSASQVKRRQPVRELQQKVIGDRRVRLLVNQTGSYTVTIEVLGPQGAWEDISLEHDANLRQREASAVYRLRCTEQLARAFAWGE